jgi:hypothetical protein
MLGLLLGCGGSTNHNANEGSAGADNAANAGNTNGASGGALNGASGAGGAGAMGATDSGGAPPLMPLGSFDSSSTHASFGLWMGFSDDSLPIGTPTVPHDGTALHLVGTTDEGGLDVFFHTGIPFEKIFSGARFWTQSDKAGSKLTVAVAGPEPLYFTDRAQGVVWPEQVITLSRAWQEVEVDFHDLGIGPEHLSPHSETFGAFHFIIEPNTAYDLWIDDFAGQPLYR